MSGYQKPEGKLQEKARELADQFVLDSIGEDARYRMKDYFNEGELKRIHNAVYNAVGEYESQEIHTALLHFGDYETEYIEDDTALDEVEPMIYNHDLLKWLAEDHRHVEYVDDAIAQGYSKKSTLIDYIQYGNGQWRRDIYSAVLDTLKEIVAESVEEVEAE